MTPPTSGRNKHTPQVVVAQRVAAIAGLLVRGSTTAEVRRVVAKAQRDEATERGKAWTELSQKKGPDGALMGGKALDEAARARVPILWGDDAIPDRTVDRYIERAKEQLVDEGLGAIENVEEEVGRQYSRALAVYHAAFRDKRYHAAMIAWEAMNRLLGAEDIARLIAPDLTAESAGRGDIPLVRVQTDGPAIPAERRAALGLVKGA